MADISASKVMELRQRTGLGMMECKKALTEADGDLAKAEELLRIKSGAKASKAAGRIAAEGVVGVYVAPDAQVGRDGRGQLRDRFRVAQRGLHRVRAEARAARRRPESRRRRRARRAAARWRHGRVRPAGAGAEDRREHVDPPLRAVRDARRARVQYLHGGGRVGVTVEIDGRRRDQVGKDIAMHIAASTAPGNVRPVCVSREDVPEDLIEKERAIYAAQAADVRQAAGNRRQDGRRPRQQVPGAR